MTAYLDTNVVVWLAGGDVRRISSKAQEVLERAVLLISPMVLIELEYLFEIERLKIRSRDIQSKIEKEIGVQVCTIDFPRIATAAIDENWTRDPFDRIIVANAKCNGLASLLTPDERIGANYAKTVW